jgi:pimeloyl-ACP methyl ester carboxylesterase
MCKPKFLVWRRIRAIASLSIVALLTGCAAPLGSIIATAPNRFNPLAGPDCTVPALESVIAADQHFFVSVGPPEVSLSVSIIEPKNSHQPPKGTVLVVHGIYAQSVWMLGPAKALSKAGYRAVLVDLRGHGRSTGKYLSFGTQEAKDLSGVIDDLERRRLVSGPIGVYGISYGATSSIHLAGIDPRVRAVVAVAPFSAMREEVPKFVKAWVPGVGWMIPEETYQQAINQAGQQAGFNPDEADATRAIRRTEAQVLLMHGTNDWIVPHRHSQRLHAAARDHSSLVLIPGHGHTVIWIDPTGEVAIRTIDWFDRWLANPADNALDIGAEIFRRQPPCCFNFSRDAIKETTSVPTGL